MSILRPESKQDVSDIATGEQEYLDVLLILRLEITQKVDRGCVADGIEEVFEVNISSGEHPTGACRTVDAQTGGRG